MINRPAKPTDTIPENPVRVRSAKRIQISETRVSVGRKRAK
jgi:hypothetical protein